MRDTKTLDETLRAGVDAGRVPGVVALAADRHGVIYEGAFGQRELGKDAAMSMDTAFLYASMTKAVTGAAAMQLVEQGKLKLDAPAADVLPELAQKQVLEGFDGDTPRFRVPKTTITLRRLLTHTSGFCYEIWNAELAKYEVAMGMPGVLEAKKAGMSMPLMFDPGNRWEYGTGIDWAGRMVEAISGQPLGEYMVEHIFGPLGMSDTAFVMRDDVRARLATIHARTSDGSLAPYPLVLDQNPEMHMGGHALYGTAGDYLRFTRAILNGGELDGQRILKPETVDLMGQNHIGDLDVAPLETVAPELSLSGQLYPDMVKKWGLSFLINTKKTPEGRAAGSLAWAGIANSYYWIDRSTGVTGVYFTQILPFLDVGALSLFQAFEKDVYADL